MGHSYPTQQLFHLFILPLRPSALLLRLTLIDFGLSVVWRAGQQLFKSYGTPCYMYTPPCDPPPRMHFPVEYEALPS